MSSKKCLYQVFEAFDKQQSKPARIKVLHDNDSRELRTLLFYTFDPRVHSLVDEIPDYKDLNVPEGMGWMSMGAAFKKAYLFITDYIKMRGSPPLTMERRKVLLIQLLESLDPRDAELWVDMMKKNLNVKFLTPNLVKEAFPGLISK